MRNWIFWPHMAIEGVLTRQKCAEKWCATLWAPGLQFSVSPNSQIFNFQDFRQIGILMYEKGPSKPSILSRVYPGRTPLFFFLDISPPDFEIFGFRKMMLEQSGFAISKKNSKGVLGRPWTKRRVLRDISSTLKFQEFRKT